MAIEAVVAEVENWLFCMLSITMEWILENLILILNRYIYYIYSTDKHYFSNTCVSFHNQMLEGKPLV